MQRLLDQAQVIRKVYQADPLECPKCKGPMRVIALMEAPEIRRTLEFCDARFGQAAEAQRHRESFPQQRDLVESVSLPADP